MMMRSRVQFVAIHFDHRRRRRLQSSLLVSHKLSKIVRLLLLLAVIEILLLLVELIVLVLLLLFVFLLLLLFVFLLLLLFFVLLFCLIIFLHHLGDWRTFIGQLYGRCDWTEVGVSLLATVFILILIIGVVLNVQGQPQMCAQPSKVVVLDQLFSDSYLASTQLVCHFRKILA